MIQTCASMGGKFDAFNYAVTPLFFILKVRNGQTLFCSISYIILKEIFMYEISFPLFYIYMLMRHSIKKAIKQ